jgi:AraC family transcriptional regulator, transcriptional activator of pobA
MPFSSIHKFNEFNELHTAANGLVRSPHSDVHVFRFSELGNQVIGKMPLFRLSFYQIGLMSKADFKISFYDKEYRTEQTNALIVFKPGQLIQWQSDPNWEGYVVLFKEEFLGICQNNSNSRKDFSFLDPTKESFILVSDDEFATLSEVYEKMLYEYQKPTLESLAVVSLYAQILFHKTQQIFEQHVAETLDPVPTNSRKAQIAHQFKKLVNTELRSFKRVSDFADKLHISPKYLIESVSEVTGKSPKVIINERVISETKTMLRFTNHSISDIARAYNFTDQAHFANFFKQNTSFTPLELRARHRTSPRDIL